MENYAFISRFGYRIRLITATTNNQNENEKFEEGK